MIQSACTQLLTIETSNSAESSLARARSRRAENSVTSSGLISPSMKVRSGRRIRTTFASSRLKMPMMSETRTSSMSGGLAQ